MSRLEELIEQYCPDGVEFKQLWEVTVWDKKFNNVENFKQLKTNKFMHVSASILKNINSGTGNVRLLSTGNFEGLANKDDVENYCNFGEVITIPTGGSANIKYHNGYFVDSGNLIATTSDPTKYDIKFVYYFIVNINDLIQNFFRGSGVKHPDMTEILDIKLPTPSLVVQEEIVRILDTFEEYGLLLNKELLARQKQYEYYRNSLLNFEELDNHLLKGMLQQYCPEGIGYKLFGDIANISRGSSPRPIQKYLTVEKDGINWIRIGDVKIDEKYITETAQKITVEGSKKSKNVYKGDFLLSNSMSFGRPYIMKIDGCIHDGWLSISDFNEFLLRDFLYYVLNSSIIQKQFKQQASSGTVSNLNAAIVKGVAIPLLPIKIQEEIVRILDHFESLVNDIKIGLPAEIEARQKQFEYYRNKLLTFKEVTS